MHSERSERKVKERIKRFGHKKNHMSAAVRCAPLDPLVFRVAFDQGVRLCFGQRETLLDKLITMRKSNILEQALRLIQTNYLHWYLKAFLYL